MLALSLVPPTEPCHAHKPDFLAGTQDPVLRAFFSRKAPGLAQESLGVLGFHHDSQECAINT